MKLQFNGTHQELKDRLLPLDLDGEWSSQPHGVWKLRCRDRAGLNWSETKGTIWFDGPEAARIKLCQRIGAAFGDAAVAKPPAKDGAIFVVHGRDHEARDQLELVLRRLGLEPFVLQVTGGGGDTLIERLNA